MDTQASATTPPVEVNLDSTRSRLLLAREQCASQSSTEHLRSFGAMRAWLTARQRGAAQPER
jgi:hypothetical protein